MQSLVRIARVLLKFSRPHTLLGTLVSVNSVSLLGLVRPLGPVIRLVLCRAEDCVWQASHGGLLVR